MISVNYLKTTFSFKSAVFTLDHICTSLKVPADATVSLVSVTFSSVLPIIHRSEIVPYGAYILRVSQRSREKTSKSTEINRNDQYRSRSIKDLKFGGGDNGRDIQDSSSASGSDRTSSSHDSKPFRNRVRESETSSDTETSSSQSQTNSTASATESTSTNYSRRRPMRPRSAEMYKPQSILKRAEKNVIEEAPKQSKNVKTLTDAEKTALFEQDLEAGIRAMLSAISAIPKRYFKYNQKLSSKMDLALKRIDSIQAEIDVINSGGADGNGTRRHILQVQLMSLLHAVWRSAWEKYSPESRFFHISDMETPANLSAAEHTLNNLHLWRRTLDASTTCKHEQDILKSLRYLGSPTKLFRRSDYVAPHIYLARKLRDKESSSKELRELVREIRSEFLDVILKEKAHKDEDLEKLLSDVVEARRVIEEDETYATWGYIYKTLRNEFWIGGRPGEKICSSEMNGTPKLSGNRRVNWG